MKIRWLTVFLDLAHDPDTAEPFWARVTGTALSTRRGPDGEFATLLPPHGDAYLRVQRVRSEAGGCHLDLHVDPDALDNAAARAVDLGARERFREAGEVIVLDSPGGFPFCFVPWTGEATVPEPPDLDGAGQSRLDQLCLDVPLHLLDAERAFWAAVTGWEARTGSRPEFGFLVRPAGMPVRILFQRLDSDGARVTGHVDFSSDDRERLAAAHTAAGARTVATFPMWTTMADPTGRLYCLTARDPRTGGLPQPAPGR
ncbi:hypothetical protein GCM10009557_88360 [Virgisporangium ochraceum]